MTTDNTEQAAPRTAEYILDHGIPLTECSEEELELIVVYKTQLAVNEQAYRETVQQQRELNKQIIEDNKAAAKEANATFQALIAPFLTGSTDLISEVK